MEALDNSVLIVLTTGGTWAVSNLELAPLDDFGNIQHVIRELSGEVILWGEMGIARWRNAVVVPALDDVHLITASGSAGTVSDAIRPLYRSYVAAGYRPGFAATHRGHYILPILNGTTLVDVLVCRLDRGSAWTRWTGHAACTGYTQRVDSKPRLLGINGLRLLSLTGCFDPTASNSQDADGTNFDATITTRDYPTSKGNQPGTVMRARLRYVLTGDGTHTNPTVSLAYSSDQDGGSFATLTDKGLQAGGTGGATSDGSSYSWWRVTKKRDRIRFKITMSGAAASFVLRSLELLIRPGGKQ